MLLRNSATQRQPKAGCTPQPPLAAAGPPPPPKPRPVALLGPLRHHRGSQRPRDHRRRPALAPHRALCPKLWGRQGSFIRSHPGQLQPGGGRDAPPLLPGHSSHLFSPSRRNKAAPGRTDGWEPRAAPAHPRPPQLRAACAGPAGGCSLRNAELWGIVIKFICFSPITFSVFTGEFADTAWEV